MATIRPFMGIRPAPEYAKDVAALPYDVMNTEEAREMVKGNPYSFLHIDRAEIDLPVGTDPYSPAVYEKARDTFYEQLDKGIFTQDLLPNLYIYRLTMDGRSQTGLVVCTAIDEYLNDTIKKHELTRADKEADRIRHVDTLNANTGPIFLAYKENADAKAIIDGYTAAVPPVYDFVSEDGIGHTVWVIDSDTEEFNYYLSVLFPADELFILDYNRVVKDLNGRSEQEFLEKISENFNVSPAPASPCHPPRRHTFGMYLGGKWYLLEAKDHILSHDPVDGLDVSILQDSLLAPVLAIGDPRTDKRIDFVGGIRGLGELERRVDSGEMQVAFSMFSTAMDELMAVADAGRTMPPKSTWFEPKLRSGLFIHDLGE